MKGRIHYFITAIICFGFGLIPPVGGMTEYGMGVLGAFFTSFINPILVIIIFGSFVVSLTQSLGIKPYSKLATALLLGISYATMLGQITVPMMGTGLTFSNAFINMFQTPLPYAQYMLFMYIASILLVICSVLVMRFIIRVDVSPFAALKAEMLGTSCKVNRDQKIAAGFFLTFVIIMVALSLLPADSAVGAFLNRLGFFGVSGIILLIMMLLKKQDGTPLLDFNAMAAHLPWDAFFLTAFILVISAFLTTPETGLNAAIGAMIAPMTKLNPWVFIILVLIFAAVVTNVANNLILTIVIMPVLYRFAALVGMDGTSLIFVLFITTQLALATPGASPITAIAMSNTSIVKVVDMMKMSFIFIPIMLVATIIVCMPLASFIL